MIIAIPIKIGDIILVKKIDYRYHLPIRHFSLSMKFIILLAAESIKPKIKSVTVSSKTPLVLVPIMPFFHGIRIEIIVGYRNFTNYFQFRCLG